ncbi:hypothetical protein PRIC2_003199 [Phytophthora ramorum]
MASDWLFSASELQRSPSRRDGVSLASELERRSEACRLIARLAAALHVSLATQRAACVFLHRFFMRRSLDTSDERYVAAACLLLAAKAEDHETQGVDACRLAKALTTSEVVLSEVAGKLLQLEGDVLLALAFELEVDHSFCYIAAEVDKVVSLPHMGDSLQFTLKQTAWSFLNDSAITWTCLAVDAPLAAKAAVYAAGLFQGCVAEDTVTELGAPWWTVLETPVDVLKDAARHVLSAYTAPFVDTGALPRALVELVAIFHSDKTEANEPSEICVRGPVLPEPMTSEPQDDDFKPVEMDAEVLFPIVDGSPSIDAAFVEQTTAWIDDCVVIVKGQGKGEQSPSSPSDPCDVEKSIPLYSPMENCTQAPVIRKRTISFADNGRSLKKAKFAL